MGDAQNFQGAAAYNYNDMGLNVVMSDTDSSQNGARALEGYDPQVMLDSSWPGLSADPQQTRFDPTAVEAQIARIQGVIESLKLQPTKLTNATSQVRFGHEFWPEATNIQAKNQFVSDGVTSFTDRVLFNLESAVGALRQVLDTYHEKETANQQQVSAVQANL
jgi:hypothetical protein